MLIPSSELMSFGTHADAAISWRLLEVSEHPLEMTASALTSPAAVMRELHAVTINGTVTSVLRGACMVRLRNGDTVRATISGLERARFAPVEHLAG